jgi:CBS domain-containing protein
MSDALPLDQLKDFIRTVPPFHLLAGSAIDELVRTLVIENFPKGEIILSPEAPPTQFLYIIRSGGVRFLLKEGDKGGPEKIYDYRDEGNFGLLSLSEPSPLPSLARRIPHYLQREFSRNSDAYPDIFSIYGGTE